MGTKLKICGITTLEDARYCAAKGADYLGFIQHPESPRYVAPETAAQIVEWVYGPEPVGVFVNTPADEVNRIAEAAGFRMIQLHGNEPAFAVAEIERPVIKSIRISPDTSPQEIRRQLREYEDVVDYYLLDTYSDDIWGGTGTSFNWDVAEALIDGHHVFLAGGISVSNAEEAVQRVGPFALDVSSSLESAPGKKDFGKLDEFFQVLDDMRAERNVSG